MKKILILFTCLSIDLISQEAVLPNTEMIPFSNPNDCRILQYNAAVIGKKVVEIYKEVEPIIITEATKPSVQKQLANAGHLSHIADMLTNQHLAFCKRPSNIR